MVKTTKSSRTFQSPSPPSISYHERISLLVGGWGLEMEGKGEKCTSTVELQHVVGKVGSGQQKCFIAKCKFHYSGDGLERKFKLDLNRAIFNTGKFFTSTISELHCASPLLLLLVHLHLSLRI